jgi:hypothetical protein
MEPKHDQHTTTAQHSQVGNKIVGKGTERNQAQTKHIHEDAEAGWDAAYLVTFGEDDRENPLNFSKRVKWGIVAAVSGTGFVRIMVSSVRYTIRSLLPMHNDYLSNEVVRR